MVAKIKGIEGICCCGRRGVKRIYLSSSIFSLRLGPAIEHSILVRKTWVIDLGDSKFDHDRIQTPWKTGH